MTPPKAYIIGVITEIYSMNIIHHNDYENKQHAKSEPSLLFPRTH